MALVASQLRIAALLAGLSILSACSESKVDRPGHAVGGQSQLSSALDPSQGERVVVSTLSAADANALVANVIEPLRKDFFNLGVLLNRQISPSDKSRLLGNYNEALIRLARANDPRAQAYLLEYEEILSHGCRGREFFGCSLITDFRDVASSFDVWTFIYDRNDSDLNRAEGRLHLGWKLQNERETRRVDLNFLALAPRIEADLVANPNREREASHYTRVSRILRNAVSIREAPELTNYLRQLLENERGIQSPRRQEIRQSIMVARADEALLSQDWFVRPLLEDSRKHPLGYHSALNHIAAHGGNAMANFHIEPLPASDALFLLIDNIYTGVWSPDTARALLSRYRFTDEDRLKLKDLIRDYAKAQLLANIVESNRHMGDFFAHTERFTSSNIHIEAANASQEVQGKWVDFYNRIARVRSFAMGVFGNGSEAFRSLRIEQDVLNETVAFTVSFPHLLLLGYQMAKHRFVVRSFFSSSLDHTKVITWILQGNLGASFFDYSMNQSVPRQFSSTELLYAFHYALKTDAFTSLKVDEEDFVKTLAAEFLREKMVGGAQSFELGLYEFMRFWSSPTAAFASELRQAEQFCRAENSGQERPYQILVNAHDAGFALIPYSSFGKSLYSTQSRSSLNPNDTVKENPNFHGLDMISSTYEKSLDEARFGIGGRIDYLRDLLTIYERHLKSKPGFDRADVEAKINRVSEPLREAQHHLRRFYTMVYSHMRSFILPCYLKIIRKEFDMQNSLIQYESENLKQIYRDYHRLNALLQGSQFLANPGASPDPRVKDILARYAPKGFPNSGFVGFDRFDLSRGMFIGHRMDSIGRLESYLRQGLRTETANLPPINTGIEFTYPFNNLMDLEYFSNPRPVQMQVTSHSSPEAFAQAFIRVMNGSGGRGIPEYVNYFEWSSSWANRFDEFLTILVSLRKTGEVEIYRAGQRACLGQTQDEDCQIERTSLSNDELENGLFSILDLVGGNAGDIAAAQALQVTSRGRAMNNYRSETGAITFFDWGAGFLFHPNTRETIGLFDYAYILAANSRLGGFQVIPWRDSLGVSRVREEAGLSAVDRASQLYRARIAEQILLFRMPEDISESLRLATKSRVDSEFEKPAAIVNLADRIAERDRAQGLRRVYRVHTRRGNTHENFYIDRRIVADQESVVETFHRETNSIFRR